MLKYFGPITLHYYDVFLIQIGIHLVIRKDILCLLTTSIKCLNNCFLFIRLNFTSSVLTIMFILGLFFYLVINIRK